MRTSIVFSSYSARFPASAPLPMPHNPFSRFAIKNICRAHDDLIFAIGSAMDIMNQIRGILMHSIFKFPSYNLKSYSVPITL